MIRATNNATMQRTRVLTSAQTYERGRIIAHSRLSRDQKEKSRAEGCCLPEKRESIKIPSASIQCQLQHGARNAALSPFVKNCKWNIACERAG
jgi:sortase (surface protein transpeptidase)